jgi:alcohol dehydrogenase class IV
VLKRFENWHQPWCVLHGDEALEGLGGELKRLRVAAPALFTTRSLTREGALLARVRKAMRTAPALEFDGVEVHVPRDVVDHAAQRVDDACADGLVVVGGGSVIDTAKGVVLAAHEGHGRVLPIIVLPTTLSGSEYTNIVGILDRQRAVKELHRHDAVVPRVVVLDPALASATPARLWGTTGMKCLGDAIEQLCSPALHPVVEPLGLEAIRRLSGSLVPAVHGDVSARLDGYLGAWMALFAFAAVRPGLGAGGVLRHRAGAVSGVGHAEVACVLLPHVLNRTLPAEPRLVPSLAAVFGTDPETRAIVGAVEELVRGIGGPERLRDIGVTEDQLDEIAAGTAEDFTGSGSPVALTKPFLRNLLADAY